MSVRHVLHACGVRGGSAEVLRVSGGSTRAKVWNQIRADVTSMTVEITEQVNAAPLGAAMLAAVGAGLYRDLREAAVMVRSKETYVPHPERVALYDTLYHQYWVCPASTDCLPLSHSTSSQSSFFVV